MAGRYVCNLSPEALKKAVAELNEPEDNNARLEAIDKLREKFQKEAKGLELIRSDDAFLLRFLRVRKFDQERAYQTLKNYHEKRKERREVFDLVENPKKIENFLQTGALIPLRQGRAKDGTFVIIVRSGHGWTDSSDLLRQFAAALLTLEKLLENEEFQIYGITLLQDVAEFSITYAMYAAPYVKAFGSIMQDAMPIRVKSINYINEGFIIDTLFTLMNKIMKDKFRKRIQLHGSDPKTLHEKIDPTFLPFLYGGSGPDLNPEWWTKEILSSEGVGEETKM